VRAERTRESVLRVTTYNAHLFGDSLTVLGRWPGIGRFDDSRRVAELCNLLRREAGEYGVDVVGLTEVWDRRIATLLASELSDTYPYAAIGDLGASASALLADRIPRQLLGRTPRASRCIGLGSGLLLLSKRQLVLPAVFLEFPRPSWLHVNPLFLNVDAFAAKGILRVLVEPEPGFRVAFHLVHLQADYVRASLQGVRDKQLSALAALVQMDHETVSVAGVVCIGDLNVAAEGAEHGEMLSRLGMLDAFLAHSSEHRVTGTPPYTYDALMNPLVTMFAPDAGAIRQRLDYVLVAPQVGRSRAEVREAVVVPFLGQSDAPISDHFAVRAEISFSWS